MDLRWLVRDVVGALDRDAREAREAAAKRFLAGLDPASEEGMWFEAFAEGFPSRLEAAIAYVP